MHTSKGQPPGQTHKKIVISCVRAPATHFKLSNVPTKLRPACAVCLLALACNRGGTTWIGTEALDVSGGSSALGGMGGTPTAGSAGAGAGGAAFIANPPLFDEPLLLANLSSPAIDDDPTLTADLLELYFSTTRGGEKDIWVSSRSTPQSPWGEPMLVPALSSAYLDATPGVAPDGLTIWFESTRLAMQNDLLETDIFESRRASRSAAWSEPVPVAELNTLGRDSAPSPSSVLLMTFSSWRADTAGDTDIYATHRVSQAEPWAPASRLAEVSSNSWDQGLLRAEGSQIFISSARAANRAAGNFFWSARPSTDAPFIEPVPLDELNSEEEDQDIWVSPDLSYAVLASARSGNLELYEAFRRP